MEDTDMVLQHFYWQTVDTASAILTQWRRQGAMPPQKFTGHPTGQDRG